MKHNHIHEEQLVDFTLGKLTDDEKLEIESHLFECSACHESWKEWQHTLGTEDIVEPSNELKEKVFTSVRKEKLNKSRKKLFYSKKPAFVLSAITAFIVLCVGLYQLMNTTNDATYIVAQNDPQLEQAVTQDPNSMRLNIEPMLYHQNATGDVWLNKWTNEMFLKVNGLTPLTAKDYQLWFVHKNNKYEGKILQLKNGVVRVYYKSPDLTKLKIIKVSVEPRGGSVAPTGPNTLFVDLENQM